MKPPDETGAPAPEVKTVSASELLIDLPAAPATPAAETPPPAENAERDSLGRLFDPAKFRPEKDSLGRWKNAHAGRRKGGANTPAPAAPIPEIGPEEAPAPGGGAPSGEPTGDATPPKTDAARTDATLSPDAGGNLLARVLYGVTGWFTGDRKAAVAKGEEHKAIASTFSAFLSFRGIALVGGLALAATVICYLLDENRGESVGEGFKRRFGKKQPKPGDDAKRVEPLSDPVAVHPVAPARPAQPTGPAPIEFPE